jgi:hypothetical protein
MVKKRKRLCLTARYSVGEEETIHERLIRESRPKIRCDVQVDLRWVSEK